MAFNKKENSNRENFFVILNSNYSFSDKGFTQKTIEGICDAHSINPSQCDSSHSLFKDKIIGFGFPGTMENSVLIDKYIKNFHNLNNTNNFVLPGWNYSCFVYEKADKYKKNNINLITIDADLNSCKDKKELKKKYPQWPENLYQINFKNHLASYKAGLYAGLDALINPEKFKDADLNKSGKQIKFAILGGLWSEPIRNWALGFYYGLKKISENKNLFEGVKKDTELTFDSYKTIGGFGPDYDELSRITAKKLYRNGVSVIFNIAVGLTKNIHIAALESDEQTKDGSLGKHWVIGVDIDQGVSVLNENPDENPELLRKNKPFAFKNNKILISAIVNIKLAISKTISEKINKNILSTGPIIYDEKELVTIPLRYQKTSIWKKIQAENQIIDFDPINYESFPKEISTLKETWWKGKSI